MEGTEVGAGWYAFKSIFPKKTKIILKTQKTTSLSSPRVSCASKHTELAHPQATRKPASSLQSTGPRNSFQFCGGSGQHARQGRGLRRKKERKSNLVTRYVCQRAPYRIEPYGAWQGRSQAQVVVVLRRMRSLARVERTGSSCVLRGLLLCVAGACGGVERRGPPRSPRSGGVAWRLWPCMSKWIVERWRLAWGPEVAVV